MHLRKRFSKAREKVKRGFSKIGDKPEKGRTDVGGEGDSRPSSSLRSESASVMVEGEARGEDSKTCGEDHPVPRSVVGRGHDLGEASQADLHPPPHVEVESESGPEGSDQVDAIRPDIGNKTPTPSILRGGESEGM